LVDDVPEDVKQCRHEELISLFREEAEKKNLAQKGQVQLVLIEGVGELDGCSIVCGINICVPKRRVAQKGQVQLVLIEGLGELGGCSIVCGIDICVLRS
jgi:tRNA A37 methylthiotransferase MiaB